MPIISSPITATTGSAVTVTSADPVVNVTPSGGIIGVGAFGINVQSEATPYLADITVDSILSTTQSPLLLRDNGGSVSIGAHGVLYSGYSYGIYEFYYSTESVHVSNAGQVTGTTGIVTGAVDDIIDNSGTIRGLVGPAIESGDGNDRITNSGEIVGEVLLGAGQDKFIAKSGGTVDGTVNGGAGNDKYWIVDNTLTLADDSGTDKVLSTVSHTLGADFENLTLLGKQDINGTGNTSQNVIFGNAGHNKLKGLGGDDTIEGRKGADALYGGSGDDILDGGRGRDSYLGGAGHDTFVFSTGSGRDKIKDFDASTGAEDVDLSGLASVTGFSDLSHNHMSQIGADVVINGGDGDVLTLVGVDIADLNANDFLF